MATIAALTEGLSLGLSVAGITLSTVQKLRSFLASNKVVQDDSWDKSASRYCPESREVRSSNWVKDSFIQNELPCIKAAYVCFDGIYNFLKASGSEDEWMEKAYFSARLYIVNSNGSVATEGGDCLSLKGTDSDEEAFNKVSDFIYEVQEFNAFKEKFYSTKKTVVVLDANVIDDARHLRSAEDTKEIVSMAAITLEVLKEVANVASDGRFVKIIPGQHYQPSYNIPSLAYITARWPGTDGSAVTAIKTVHAAIADVEADFHGISERIRQCSIDDGVRNIILLGRTGAGKSHTGNWLLAENEPKCKSRFEESGAGSMTSSVDFLPEQNSSMKIWDTPGLDDAYNRDEKHMADIEQATLEMGTVNAVILCFPNIERIDGPMRAVIRKYSRIIGEALWSRLVVVINRQPSEVSEDQKNSLKAAFYREGHHHVGIEQMYDLGPNTPNLKVNKVVALRAIMGMCAMTAVKVGYLERLSAGLLELDNFVDPEEKEYAKEKLLCLSSRALRRKLTQAQGRYPLTARFNDGKRFILSDGRDYKDRKGNLFIIEHILNMPESMRLNFRNVISVFVQGMKVRHGTVQAVSTKVREMRLVFAGRPTSTEEMGKAGLLTYKRQIHYTLLPVDAALTDDVRSLLRYALGDDGASDTDVTLFSTPRPRPGPKRRHPVK